MKYLIGEQFEGIPQRHGVRSTNSSEILPLGSQITVPVPKTMILGIITGDFLKLPRPNCKAYQDLASLSEVASESFPFFF